MAEKQYTLAEKRALAEKLGTGGAARAGKALANRQAELDAAMEDSRGPKDDSFDEAVKQVKSATKKKGGALTKSNYW